MLKNKVMEDLDALLADLQSTTTNMGGFNHHHYHPADPPPYTPVKPLIAPKPTPPPTLPKPTSPPPLGSPGIMSSPHRSVGPSVSRSASTATVSSSTSRTSQGTDTSSREPTPPPLPPHPAPEDLNGELDSDRDSLPPLHSMPPPPPKPVTTHPDMMPGHGPPAGRKGQPGALSANLSELDILLQDLSSAQFMEAVDGRSSIAESLGHPMSPPASVSVATRPPQERSVDSLLFELENTVTTPRHQQHPVIQNAMMGVMSSSSASDGESHYEAVRLASNHHPSGASMTASELANQSAAASTATRELEDLMESLSEFKVGGPATIDPPYAQPNKINKHSMAANVAANTTAPLPGAAPPALPYSQQAAASFPQHNNHEQPLETMLGNLNTDMTRQGIITIPKGHCAACRKPIVGQVITALGKIWHPEHFSCVHCGLELGTCNFYEREGQPYCEQDYHALFSPKCAGCGGPILDKCVTALDQTWHPEHFICAKCGREFGEDGFHEKEGKAFCRDDYFELFAPKCGGCAQPIMDNYISAINRQWHPECFVCQECHMPFGTGSFYDHEGLPYCETHYHARRGSLCAGCQKPITGRCITAMFKKYHPEHFVCAFCVKQLNKGTFKEQNDKPYCHPCYVKLFG